MKYDALNRIFNKPSFSCKFECLELDNNFCIVNKSEQVQRFSALPEELMQGKDVRLSFPEFIGFEEVMTSILQGKQEFFEFQSVGRFYENKADVYMNLYIIGEQYAKESDNRLIILIEDITDRITFQQRLAQRANEANLLSSALMSYKNYMDQVLASIADALLVTSISGKIKKVNRATQKLFGFSEKELINQPISLIIDENQLLPKAIRHNSLFEQHFQNLEVVCRTKTKEKILVAFSCSIIKKTVQGLEDIVYIGRDITLQRRREERTIAQSTITRILSESQSVKQVIPQILQSICQSIGWDLGELWTPSQYISQSVQRYSTNVILRCVEIWSSRLISVREFKAITWQTTYTPGVGLPGRIWTRRSPFWIRDIAEDTDSRRSQPAAEAGLHGAYGFPILDEDNILGVMVFLSREVQPKDPDLLQMMGSIGSQIAQFIKRRQAENALVESEERYRDLFENANDLIQSVNAYGRFLYVNRAWQETFGYTEAEITNMNVFDIIHPDYKQYCWQKLYSVMSGEKLEQVKAVFVTKDGQTIFLEGNINCKFVEGHPVATRGIFRNITQRLAAEEALRYQQEQSEQLLLNILPTAISYRYKEPATSVAEDFAEITVLYADIVDYAEIAASMSAIQLVNLFNHVFSAFDRLTEKYGLEKIKTINNAYVVVAGLPTRRLDHAQAIAQMALDMQTAIALFNAEYHQNFKIRTGIHSGSVNLWEDTVNIASSMESQGIAGKIQVTEETYNRLHEQFLFEKRGKIEIQGKGTITTYLLIGQKILATH